MHSSDPRLFAKALAAFQNARHEEAERGFKRILRSEPKHFGALNLYAILLMQTGRVGEAVPLLRKATTVESRSDATFYNLGLALKQLKRPAEALEALDKSIALKPNNPESWNNRGTVFNDLGDYTRAIQDFDRALELNPSYAEAMSNRGRSLFLREQYNESADAYDGALRVNPSLAEAWMGRGAVQFRLRQWDDALKAFETAIKIRGNFQEAWIAAGNTRLELNRPSEAVQAFETALGFDEKNSAAWIGLANGLLALDQIDKALVACDTASRIEPESIDFLIARANFLAKANRLNEALQAFDAADASRPGLYEAQIGRGNILKSQKKYTEAIASFDAALAVKPRSPEAHVGRGNALNELGKQIEALAEYDLALNISPRLAEAWLGKGLAHSRLGEFKLANAAFHTSLGLNSGLAESWVGLGFSLNQAGKPHEALEAYERAAKIKPRLAEAWLGIGTVQLLLKNSGDAVGSFAHALELDPELPFAKGDFLHAKGWNCDWSNHAAEWESCSTDIDLNRTVVTAFPSLALGLSSTQLLTCARLAQNPSRSDASNALWRGEIYSHQRIRIAYVSGDFKQHPVSYLSAGVFEQHDRSRFETIGISVGADDKSPVRARIAAAFSDFIDSHKMSNLEIARMLREREVDIVVDLGGHTAGSRIALLALRPAPVQATYLGYPGTTGADFVDYLIADPTVIPPDQQSFYSENVAYLPDCYLPNDKTRAISSIPDRMQTGLPPSGFVFCSFNQPYKITPAIFDVWMRLLSQTSDSILWLPKFEATACENIQREAKQRGINKDRIVFADRTESQEDHLARLSLADLFLDTPGYNAHSTACDALWAGVPLVTCIGSTFAGRVGASALKAVGLPELITTSLDDYEALALKLATEPALLASVKAKLMAQRLTAPLFNTERFTRNLEAIYLKMWQRAQAGEAPAPLSL